jgi:hypothetical protein
VGRAGKHYGVIQHSFGLQIPDRSRPFHGQTNQSRVADRFNRGPFRARQVGSPVGDVARSPQARHSPLAQTELTTLDFLQPRFIGPGPPAALPQAVDWANMGGSGGADNEPSLIFADKFDDGRSRSINDFLISKATGAKERQDVSQLLLELMAHKRSRLFGFPLANRVVNVLLPHAILHPKAQSAQGDAWFMQPLVSFIRDGRVRARLRSTYSLTFFFIPVIDGSTLNKRKMKVSEIEQVVNAGWVFAAAPPATRTVRFAVRGELPEYLSATAGSNLRKLDNGSGSTNDDRTLRAIVEWAAFGVGLTLAQGRSGRANLATVRLIGNDVVTSLGSARVSSVIVVDDNLKARKVRKPIAEQVLPSQLASLMERLTGSSRGLRPEDKATRKLRLDRPFVDSDGYAIGVLPTSRCLVVVSRRAAQRGIRESALMQAGSIAYMTIGAATAVGTLRAIDRRLEHLDDRGPAGIAEIDREIAADLGEIYDLDITRESYRGIYRHLRERLGITRDYELLQDKMKTLYRATSTLHEEKAQRLLAWLTAAIVALSLLILIGTVVLVGNGG